LFYGHQTGQTGTNRESTDLVTIVIKPVGTLGACKGETHPADQHIVQFQANLGLRTTTMERAGAWMSRYCPPYGSPMSIIVSIFNPVNN
jgi:hypothetical protein